MGGAIYNQGDLTLSSCIVTENAAINEGGGIKNITPGSMTMTACEVYDNEADWGGGIYSNTTLVIADSNSGGGGNQGNYRIYLAQVPGTIAPSDDGGRLVSGVAAAAQIQVGDLDVWQVFACRGSAIHLQLDRITNSNNFDPLLEIYDPAGRLLLSRIAPPSATADILANQGGIYTFLVRDSASGGYNGTGDYKITATGILSDEVQLCQPMVREEGIELAGIGGMPLSSKAPSRRQSAAISRSPCSTRIFTAV